LSDALGGEVGRIVRPDQAVLGRESLGERYGAGACVLGLPRRFTLRDEENAPSDARRGENEEADRQPDEEADRPACP